MEYTLLGVVVTYMFIMHGQPYLELLFEYVKHEVSSTLEWRQLGLEQHKMDIMRKYPEMHKEVCNTVVEGFQYEPEEECFDDDYDDEGKKIGYKHI